MRLRTFSLIGTALCFSLIGAAACSDAGGGGSQIGAGGSSAAGGNAGSAGFTDGGGGFGNSGNAGGSSGSGGLGPGCASDSYTGELVPLDMLIMLDRSASMTQDSDKWGAVTGAINQFVGLPGTTDISVGLDFFPKKPSQPPPTGPCTSGAQCGGYECTPIFNTCSGAIAPNDSCVGSDYANPQVPIAPLPGVGGQIISAINGQSPSGDSTPISPALEGAISYAQGWAQQNPEHITIVVLASDGEPTNCDPNRVETAAAWADVGFMGNPSIQTFVIGIGQLTSLNQIAAAGGTGQALIISATNNTGQEFLDKLNEIRGAVGCNYKIPAATGGGDPDYSKINVAFTPAGGAQDVFPQVAGPGQCAGGKGWYYDNPANPSQIVLCPASCDQVENVDGVVDVVVGCETIVK